MLNLTSLAIIWVGSHRIDAGEMQVGAMIASLQYAMQILFAVFMVTAMFVMLPARAASAARINEVLDVSPEVVDPAGPAEPPRAAQTGTRRISRTSPFSIRAPRNRRSRACRSRPIPAK
jgi:ATP-binding cassette subfamily B protein